MQIRIGDKMVEAEINEAGVPVIKTTSEEIRHPNGRVDVVIHVPFLRIVNKSQE